MARVLASPASMSRQSADIDIRHVAQRDDLREADIVVGRPVDQRCGDGAGLRQQRDVAGLGRHMRKSGIEL